MTTDPRFTPMIDAVTASMAELAAITGIEIITHAPDTWDRLGDAFGTHRFGYLRPLPLAGGAWGAARVCPAIIVDQAAQYLGTNLEASLLASTHPDAPMANAVGVYVHVLQLLIAFEIGSGSTFDPDDHEGRKSFAESRVWDAAPDDLCFFKQVQARVLIRAGAA